MGRGRGGRRSFRRSGSGGPVEGPRVRRRSRGDDRPGPGPRAPVRPGRVLLDRRVGRPRRLRHRVERRRGHAGAARDARGDDALLRVPRGPGGAAGRRRKIPRPVRPARPPRRNAGRDDRLRHPARRPGTARLPAGELRRRRPPLFGPRRRPARRGPPGPHHRRAVLETRPRPRRRARSRRDRPLHRGPCEGEHAASRQGQRSPRRGDARRDPRADLQALGHLGRLAGGVLPGISLNPFQESRRRRLLGGFVLALGFRDPLRPFPAARGADHAPPLLRRDGAGGPPRHRDRRRTDLRAGRREGAPDRVRRAVRGTPVLLQLFVLYYGLSSVVRLPAFAAALLGLGLNYAAYEGEIYRGALEAVSRVQLEAARTLGFSEWLILRLVRGPQAFRLALAPMTNDFVALLKDSSLVSVITVVELTKQTAIFATNIGSWVLPGILCAAIYLAMSLPLSRLARRLDRRWSATA